MISLTFLAATSFLMALFFTPIFRNLSLRLGLVDHPDQKRKLHPSPMPRTGGIPILISYVAALALLVLLPTNGAELIRNNHPNLFWIVAASGIVFVTGLVDDLVQLKPWQKLLGQCVAASVAFYFGVQIHSLSGYSISWWSYPVTLLWLVACTNAFNLIDGVDGLASGIGLFATLTTLIAGLLHSDDVLVLATAPLAGALLGFLRYNFNPASIFLGDSGSFVVGFLLGCYAVLWSFKAATLLGMTAPLMMLAVPLLDTVLAVGRRFLRRQPLFSPDHGHIHHRLLAMGFGPRKVVLILYGVCGVAAAFSLIQSTINQTFIGGILVVLFCVGVWFGVQQLGYVEFGFASRMLIGGTFRKFVNAQLSLQNFQEALKGAGTLEDACQLICDRCGEFGFVDVELCLLGKTYVGGERIETDDPAERGNGAEVWTVHIALSPSDSIVLRHHSRHSTDSSVAFGFVNSVHNALLPMLLESTGTLNGDAADTAGVENRIR